MDKVIRYLWSKIEWFTEKLFQLFHIDLSEKQKKDFFQFVKFGIIGLSNTVVSYVIYLGTLFFLQSNNILPKHDYLIGNLTGFIVSVLWSFFWNRQYVFTPEKGKRVSLAQALIKTYISYAFTGLFLNGVLSVFWVEVAGIPKIYAPILNLLISVPLNYFMNKYWAFRAR